MTEQPHLIRRHPAVRLALAGARIGLPLLLMAGLGGCRHKRKPFVLPQSTQAPMELEIPPALASLPVITPQPVPAFQPQALPPPPKPSRKRRSAPAPKEAPPPPVSTPDTAALAIGDLTTGGASTPQSQQQAKDLIGSIQKRLAALPSKTANQKKEQVRQVRYFLKQAQQALDSGDADGAKNLATKAKVLMDDLEKI